MTHPSLCVVDTNVAKAANLATSPDSEADTPPECILASVEALEYVKNSKALVIDDSDEIFSEYGKQLSFSGQPGMGDAFFKWVHDHRYSLPESQRVSITKKDDSYAEFPEHEGLADFDIADKKFVAVANAHSEEVTILQATDSKWWGWKDALEESGIPVLFLCEKYIEQKYKEKMG